MFTILTQSVTLGIISVSERDENKTKIKDKLRKLISKRPPIEELEKKGIIKGSESTSSICVENVTFYFSW